MKMYAKMLATALTVTVAIANAEEVPLEATEAAQAPRETFRKWRVSVGGAMNGAVSAKLGPRNLTAPAGYSVGGGSFSRIEAQRRAQNHRYDGGGYLDESGDGWGTRDWKLPTSTYYGNGLFKLHNAYEEVTSSSVTGGWQDGSDDRCQYGISAEVSREIWIHDEADEHRWGVDFAAAFSYFFGRDIYRAQGQVTRTDMVREGEFITTIDDPDAMYLYDTGYDSPSGGMYGHGADFTDYSPMILWENVGPTIERSNTRAVSASNRYSASGDYRELEMLFMFRPWYELTDWWRVYGQIGVGVSWGSFETDFCANGVRHGENFRQWDCYGVAGLGTMVRYGRFDLSVDFLGRFLRDDLDVNGRYLSGKVDRSDWGFRVMVGVEF